MTLWVDKTTQQGIVRDPGSNVWGLRSIDNPWDKRQPFSSTEDTELPPVPRHHKYTLGLPLERKESAP